MENDSLLSTPSVALLLDFSLSTAITFMEPSHNDLPNNLSKNPIKPPSFDQFLTHFPEIALPVTLAEGQQLAFSRQNDPLTPLMIERFISPAEAEERDELTEYVPCFRIPDTPHYLGLIYWRGSLLNYEFNLITYSTEGEIIDRKPIASTSVQQEQVVQSAVTIKEDRSLVVVEGLGDGEEALSYEASDSKVYQLFLEDDGRIQF